MVELIDPMAELRQIVDLNKHVHPIEAEQRFERLIEECSAADLRALDAELAAALGTFNKKRYRHLKELLAERLSPAPPFRQVPDQSEQPVPSPGGISGQPVNQSGDRTANTANTGNTAYPLPGVTPAALAARASGDTGCRTARQVPLAVYGRPSTVTRYSAGGGIQDRYNYEKFSEALVDLGNDHVFQWSTAYRHVLSDYFSAFHEYLCGTEKPSSLLRNIKAALSDHSREVFKKVFELYTARTTSDATDATTKTLAGLQRFLDLVLEFYSAKLDEAQRRRESAMLRQLCSAMVFGILNGYGKTQFRYPGSRVLPEFSQYWTYALPFLTHRDLNELIKTLEAGDFIAGIQVSVLPLVDALDSFLDSDPELAPLPALSQYDSTLRRLDVSLQTPAGTNSDRLYEIQCYTDTEYVHLDLIEKAVARAVRAVVALLPDELRGLLADIDRFSEPRRACGRDRVLQVARGARRYRISEHAVVARQAGDVQLGGRVPARESGQDQV